jgi:predicted  nucleic acid-binding Zn-ribbon protein
MAPNEMSIDPNHIIQTLTHQRNAAMDEIVKMSAIIGALEAQIKELTKEVKADDEADQ